MGKRAGKEYALNPVLPPSTSYHSHGVSVKDSGVYCTLPRCFLYGRSGKIANLIKDRR
jgi:hypothetical protein